MGNISWAQYAKLTHCLEPHVFALVRDVCPVTIFAIRAVNNFVVNVGDIGHQSNLHARPFQITTQNVVHQCGSTVTQMRWPVHGWATQIDAQLAWLSHFQFAHLARNGVVQMQHGSSLEAQQDAKPSCAPIQLNRDERPRKADPRQPGIHSHPKMGRNWRLHLRSQRIARSGFCH